MFEILPRDKFLADFYSKMSVCSHELGGGVQPPNPPTIPTLLITNRKSYMRFRLTPRSMTLDYLELLQGEILSEFRGSS